MKGHWHDSVFICIPENHVGDNSDGWHDVRSGHGSRGVDGERWQSPKIANGHPTPGQHGQRATQHGSYITSHSTR